MLYRRVLTRSFVGRLDYELAEISVDSFFGQF